MQQKELSTQQLQLVPLSKQHLSHQIMLDTDPDVMHFLGGVRTQEVCVKELEENLAEASNGLGYWAGFVDSQFAGYWILRIPDMIEPAFRNTTGELGYRLLPNFWRQGLGKEGSRELLRYGFEDLKLDAIVAFTAAKNTASRATMASSGLKLIREFEVDASGWPEGTDLQAVEYAISAEDWLCHNK